MAVIPGSDGRFAVTPGHIPVMCEMQPGILSLYHERSETSGRSDHYFVAGGMCLVHPDASLEIAATEAILLADIDPNVCISFPLDSFWYLRIVTHRTFEREWQRPKRKHRVRLKRRKN